LTAVIETVAAGFVPAITSYCGKQDADARQRRQVYAVCASLTACRAWQIANWRAVIVTLLASPPSLRASVQEGFGVG